MTLSVLEEEFYEEEGIMDEEEVYFYEMEMSAEQAEEIERHDLAIDLLPFFKQFLLHSTRKAIMDAVDNGEEDSVIENHILDFNRKFSSSRSEQIYLIKQVLEDEQSKLGILYFKGLFNKTLGLMKQ